MIRNIITCIAVLGDPEIDASGARIAYNFHDDEYLVTYMAGRVVLAPGDDYGCKVFAQRVASSGALIGWASR